MNIKFVTLPNDDFTYMGITSDIVKSIIADDIPIGIVYLSDVMDEGIYMEYIEFLSVFTSKKLLRPVMKALYEEYGKVYFESGDELVKKYVAIGATKGDRDDDREMTSFTYAA